MFGWWENERENKEKRYGRRAWMVTTGGGSSVVAVLQLFGPGKWWW